MPRPNVFNQNIPDYVDPRSLLSKKGTSETTEAELPKVNVDAEYEAKRTVVATEVYSTAIEETSGSGYDNAIQEMQERTRIQLEARNAQLKKNQEDTDKYQKQMAAATTRPASTPEVKHVEKPVRQAELKATIPMTKVIDSSSTLNAREASIRELSQPQFNTAFDVIPLPSGGKLYKSKKPSVKVAYMTTATENILTSPNLVQSGEFLEILINRTLLEPEIRYKDLHVGDRNAIMLWLRATSYGDMYPVTLLDEEDVPFETEIDLSTLKSKPLGDTPDDEGYFDFYLPKSKAAIKFKLLNVGDLEEIEKLVAEDVENGVLTNNTNTYKLQRQIVEVNGNRNREDILLFIQGLRAKDGNDLREHIEKIESGVDLELEIPTPRGGSIKTFFPLNISFFWPNIKL